MYSHGKLKGFDAIVEEEEPRGKGDRKYRSALGSFVESLGGSDEDRIKEVIRARDAAHLNLLFIPEVARPRCARSVFMTGICDRLVRILFYS